MQAKTIIITLPKPLAPGAQVKGVITPQRTLIAAPNTFKIIKAEPPTCDVASECQATKRRREKLDHLTIDQKVLRRKLKNRVAAQTARDKKKAQLEDLEIEVIELKQKMALLEQKNSRLESEKVALETDMTKCTCRSVKSTSAFHSTVGSAMGSGMQGSCLLNADAGTIVNIDFWDDNECPSLQTTAPNVSRKRTYSEMDDYPPATLEGTGGILECPELSSDDHIMIDEIAKALDEAKQQNVPSTPELVKNLLSFDPPVRSPATKEQIMDFLQVPPTRGDCSSESGYDSPISPESHSSEYSLENECFGDLLSSWCDE